MDIVLASASERRQELLKRVVDDFKIAVSDFDEKKVEFKDIRIENFDYEVIFELKINNDYKTNEFILDTLENEVYVFNSIFTKPKIYKSLNEIFEVFKQEQIEVKDAF